MKAGWRPTQRLLGVTAAVALVSVVLTDGAMAQRNTGNVSLSTGVDFSHAYFFRGIIQERTGIVAQPYMDITFSLFEGTEGLDSVSFTIGQWNSLHSGPSGADGPAANVWAWYESDFFTGVTLGLDNWEAGITHTSYLRPNDAFGTIHELSMDDSELLGPFALSPHIALAIELSGQADGGASEGAHLELGVEPGVDIVEGTASVGFLVRLDLSLNNYYEDGGELSNTFGYFDVGTVVALPFGVPETFGSW